MTLFRSLTRPMLTTLPTLGAKGVRGLGMKAAIVMRAYRFVECKFKMYNTIKVYKTRLRSMQASCDAPIRLKAPNSVLMPFASSVRSSLDQATLCYSGEALPRAHMQPRCESNCGQTCRRQHHERSRGRPKMKTTCCLQRAINPI